MAAPEPLVRAGAVLKLSQMHRILALVALLALVGSSAALAARGDPQKRILPADQARARAMLLRPADLPGFRTSPSGGDRPTPYCRALDESDLTLTGDAQSPDFATGFIVVGSVAQVYATTADSDASWRRGTSAAGQRCLRDVLASELGRAGVQVVSYRPLSFPRLVEKSVAYRAVLSAQNVRLTVDLVALKQGRAQATLLFGSGLTAFERLAEIRLARVVAARMERSMRGAS